ncbi:hypothetical protein BDN70DRAFT_897084 [Pholiota conissans]|uniref:Uncharacterized protein n=1 Tax=Pholiota conissans TaxID=109636 RepID=A0A9P6CXY4_9AGAR|nr:hypothetical protein BDN70DRAFT_897084 [Pholiota conissans]
MDEARYIARRRGIAAKKIEIIEESFWCRVQLVINGQISLIDNIDYHHLKSGASVWVTIETQNTRINDDLHSSASFRTTRRGVFADPNGKVTETRDGAIKLPTYVQTALAEESSTSYRDIRRRVILVEAMGSHPTLDTQTIGLSEIVMASSQNQQASS